MRTKSIPLFRNHRPGAPAWLSRRRTPGSAPQISRHLGWILEILAKHFHREPWRGLRSGVMVLPIQARRTFFRLGTNIFHVAPRFFSTARLGMAPAAPGTTRIFEPQIVEPRILVEHRESEPFKPFTLRERGRPRRESNLTANEPVTPPLPLARYRERSIFERVSLRSNQPNGDRGLQERIIRRMRRLEQPPLDHARPAALRRTAPAEPERAPNFDRSRREAFLRAEFEAHALRGAVQPSLAPNVAQITDAVLQQLDRRLVAARERMGRI